MVCWEVSRRALKEDIDIIPYRIRFLPFRGVNYAPYDVFALVGLFSLWKCHMVYRHTEPPIGQPSAPLGNRPRWCGALMRRRVIHGVVTSFERVRVLA